MTDMFIFPNSIENFFSKTPTFCLKSAYILEYGGDANE